MATLQIERLSVRLPAGADRPHAVHELSLSIEPGRTLCIVGESGSGKTTIALSLLGYARPGCRIAGGSIRLGETEVVLEQGVLGSVAATGHALTTFDATGALGACAAEVRVRDGLAGGAEVDPDRGLLVGVADPDVLAVLAQQLVGAGGVGDADRHGVGGELELRPELPEGFRAAVIGGSGYGGAEMIRRLLVHPDVELVRVASVDFVGEPLDGGATALRFGDQKINVHPPQMAPVIKAAVPTPVSMNSSLKSFKRHGLPLRK